MLKQPREKTHPHTIRFPEFLYQQLGWLAREDDRTFNSEVIYFLKKGLEAEDIPLQNSKEEMQD